jgi:hypothetical protein
MKTVIAILFSLSMIVAASAEDRPTMSVEQRLALQIANLTLQNTQLVVEMEKMTTQVDDLKNQISVLKLKPDDAAKTIPKAHE